MKQDVRKQVKPNVTYNYKINTGRYTEDWSHHTSASAPVFIYNVTRTAACRRCPLSITKYCLCSIQN